MNENETIQGIIGDIRNRAAEALRFGRDYPEKTVHHEAVGIMLRDFGDRLDAATKALLDKMQEVAQWASTGEVEGWSCENCVLDRCAMVDKAFGVKR